MNQNKKNLAQPEAGQSSAASKHKWQYDVLLLAIFAILCGGFALYFHSRSRTPDQTGDETAYYVQVEVNNRVEALISIEDEGDYTFENIYSNGENVVHVGDGGVFMHSANCPDQVCVYQGVIEPGTVIPIVCMPNYVYVRIVASDEIEWDDIRESVVPEELMPLYEASRS